MVSDGGMSMGDETYRNEEGPGTSNGSFLCPQRFLIDIIVICLFRYTKHPRMAGRVVLLDKE
jgi:hypothetical protein